MTSCSGSRPRPAPASIPSTPAAAWCSAGPRWTGTSCRTNGRPSSIYGPGDYRWKGADLGVLVTKGRLQVDNGQGKSSLAIRARHLIDSIRAEYAGTPIAEPAAPQTNTGLKSG